MTSVQQVFNLTELHFSEVYFFQNWYNKETTSLHAIWSYNKCCDFSSAGSSLFLRRFSLMTFLSFLGPFLYFHKISRSLDIFNLFFIALVFHITIGHFQVVFTNTLIFSTIKCHTRHVYE